MSALRTATSHAVAAAVVVLATLVGSVLAYLGLLAWAVLADEGVGGPLALPFMMLVALVAGVAAVVIVLGPATQIADWICAGRDWPRWSTVPLSVLVATVLCLTAGAAVGAWQTTVADGLRISTLAMAALLAPLGLYWWSLRAAALLLQLAGRARRAVTRRFRSPTTA